MRNFLINTVYATLRWYVSTNVFDRLAALVLQLTNVDIPGSEKRAQVIEFAANEFGLIQDEANNIVIDAVIAVTRLKAKAP